MKNLYLIIIAFVLGILIYTILPKFCGCDRVLEGHGEHDNQENRDLIYHILNSIDYKAGGEYTNEDIPNTWEDIWTSECDPNGNKIYNQARKGIEGSSTTCSDKESYDVSETETPSADHLERLIIRLIHHIQREIISDQHNYNFDSLGDTGPLNEDEKSNLIKLAKVANILINFHQQLHINANTNTGVMHSFLSTPSRKTLLSYYNSSEGEEKNEILDILREGCPGQSWVLGEGSYPFEINTRTASILRPSSRTIFNLPFQFTESEYDSGTECPEVITCNEGRRRDNPEYAGLCKAFRDNRQNIDNINITSESGFRLPGTGNHTGYTSNTGAEGICLNGWWYSYNQELMGNASRTTDFIRPSLSESQLEDLNRIPELIYRNCAGTCFCDEGSGGLEVAEPPAPSATRQTPENKRHACEMGPDETGNWWGEVNENWCNQIYNPESTTR